MVLVFANKLLTIETFRRSRTGSSPFPAGHLYLFSRSVTILRRTSLVNPLRTRATRLSPMMPSSQELVSTELSESEFNRDCVVEERRLLSL